MHVELFLQFKVHDIKWKLAPPPCNKSNFILSPLYREIIFT